MKKIIKEILDDHIRTIGSLQKLDSDLIDIAQALTTALKNGKKLLFCGNGGSASDAQHIATEFVVRFRSDFNRKSLPALALTTNSSLITAAANDYGFNEIFSRQIEGLGEEGDYLIGISTSGNSMNVFKAIETAKAKNMHTLLLTGKDGGKIKNIVDKSIIVTNYNTARIQEAHITVGHILCLLVEKLYFKEK